MRCELDCRIASVIVLRALVKTLNCEDALIRRSIYH